MHQLSTIVCDDARQEVGKRKSADSLPGRAVSRFVVQSFSIDTTFAPERKAQLIEELWRAAYSDGVLRENEEHLIRRVANLLHVPHSRFIVARLRVLATLERGK